MLHFGTHGSLEFTPARMIGLLDDDWPDALTGPVPHYYLYVINNIGEALAAKRRSYATLIGHLTAPFMNAGLSGELASLDGKLHAIESADNPMLAAEYRRSAGELAEKLGIVKDLKLTLPLTDAGLERLHNHLHEIADSKVARGMYVLGRPYSRQELDETALLMTVDDLAARFAEPDLTDEARKNLASEYTAEYYRIRREQLRFIIENKSSLAAVYALYQRLPGDAYLFNGDSDVVYYRTVAEALEQSYPDSPYLQTLLAEITRMEARQSLSSRITESGYPDLELMDIYGKKIRLSSLAGKVILLDFWSAELGSSNTLNADLKEIYRKYADAPVGFEVYQVAIDTSKAIWITAVQEQQLPWVSVSDLRGRGSAALGLYNVQKLPTNFLIDRNGTIVARDIYGEKLERELDELTR